MVNEQDKTRWDRLYPTWGDFLEACNGTSRMDERQRSSRKQERKADPWAGTTSWGKAKELAENGWQSEVADAQAFASHVADVIFSERLAVTFDLNYDVAGSSVDIGRFLSGEPECMTESAPIVHSSHGRAVSIVVPVSFLAEVPPRLVRQRGAAIIALVDALARAQHPLEIWAASIIHDWGHTNRASYVVKVQAADAPLDMGRIMYALAHPSMLRRHIFSLMETEGSEFSTTFRVGHGYGTRQNDAFENDIPPINGSVIVLPGLTSRDDWSEGAAIKWVNDTLDFLMGEG